MRAVTLLLALSMTAAGGCATAPGGGPGSGGSISREARAYNHYMAGVVHLRNGRFEEAAQEYRKASELQSDSATPLLELMHVYIRLDDYQNARRTCSRVLKLRPHDASLWSLLGLICQRLNDYEGMTDAFQRAVQLNPRDITGYERLLEAGRKSNDIIALIDVYLQLIKLRPDFADLHYHLGVQYTRINDMGNARESLERALELKPDLEDARYVLGVVYMQQNENELAVEQFQQFMAVQPDHVPTRESLAGVYGRLGRFDEAVALLSTLAENNEADPAHYVARMYLLIRGGHYTDALAAAPPEGAPIFAALLSALARKSLGEPYIPILETLDRIDSDVDLECQTCLTELLILLGKQDAGQCLEYEFRAFRDAGVKSRTLDTILARVLLALERYDEAEQLLLAALEQHGADKWLHYYLAEVYEHGKRVRRAERHLKACLELEPDNPDVLNFLGYMWADADMKLDEAEKLLNRALKIDPGNGFYLDSLGWVHYRKGNADKAIELIRQAIIAMDTDDAILRSHLGDAYLLRGDKERALAQWNRAIRLDPALDDVQQKIDKYERKKRKRRWKD